MIEEITTIDQLVNALNDWQAQHDQARQDPDYAGGWNYWDMVDASDPHLIDWDRAADTPTTLDVPLADGTRVVYQADTGQWVHLIH